MRSHDVVLSERIPGGIIELLQSSIPSHATRQDSESEISFVQVGKGSITTDLTIHLRQKLLPIFLLSIIYIH
jgi:hypothetical protein